MKILAIASVGGHWIQLLRLVPKNDNDEIVFISTNPNLCSTVKGYEFHAVPDASRWNKLKLLWAGLKIFKKVYNICPDVIITTGAAPGLMGIIAGRFLGVKTIWIDSIANVEKISLSGRIAKLFATRTYTQWPELASKKVLFVGNVL